MRLMLAAVSVLIAITCANATPVVDAIKVTEPPVIDGKLADTCWGEPAPIRDFVVLGNDQQAANQTEAWLAYDSENLYVAIKAYDDRMADLKATVSERDGAVFGDDSIEVFLDPALDQFHFVQFATNPLGTRYDASGDAAGGVPDWNGLWSVGTARAGDHWSAELKIPFASLPLASIEGDTWGLNICRTRAADGELSCWSQTSDMFARPQRFGAFRIGADLSAYMLDLVVASWGEGIQGRNQLACQVTNRSAVPRDVSLRLTVGPPDENPRDISQPLGEIAAGATARATLAYQTFQEGAHDLTLALIDAAGELQGRTTATEGRRLTVASTAEFSVSKSFYRDHVTVAYDLRVRQDELGQYKVVAELKAAGDEAGLDKASAENLTVPRGTIQFPTARLSPGRYEIHVGIIGPDGAARGQNVLHFPVLRDDKFGERLVTVRDDNMLIVEGQPFFPLGIYEQPGSDLALRTLSEAGFNLCMASGTRETFRSVLDKAEEYGLHMWLPIGGALDLSEDSEKRREQLREYADLLGDHPALLCWESIDEPAWGSQSAEGLYEGYCAMRTFDQNHPIWMNHAPRNLISTLTHYNRGADISGCDIYPVPEPTGHSNLPDKTLAVTGDETDKNREAVLDEKPIFMVIQGFGWRELSKEPEVQLTAIMPTFEQSRFMAYDAVVHGATGLLYWGTHYTAKPSRFFSELKTLVSELADLHEVLASRTQTGDGCARVDGDEESVVVMQKNLGDSTFIIAVNEVNEPRTVRLKMPTLKARQVRRLFEDKRLPVSADSVVELELDGYGVAVLTDDADFVDTRKDFSDDWKNVPAAEDVAGLLREPGNAVSNPGMEVDRNSDEVPDQWSIRYPFSGVMTQADAHGGKSSVQLTGLGGDIMPLAIQSALPLKGNTAHRLTAWAKTAEAGTEFRVYVEWNIGDTWTSGMGPWIKGSGQWEQTTVDFTTTPDPQGRAYLVLQMRGTGKVSFDDIVLSEAQ